MIITGQQQLVTLTCEICKRKFNSHYDPKVITPNNTIAPLFYCCSLKCEAESWKRIDSDGNRIDANEVQQ